MGLYWATEKPGSGKSTLMKFLVGHEMTYKLLSQWAYDHGSELVLASHFFWNTGTHIQKSQDGLLRTILYRLALEWPEVVVDLVPDHFKTEISALTWTPKELLDVILAFSH